MQAIDGKKVYIIAALYAFGYGFWQAGIFSGDMMNVDWQLFWLYLFEGGFLAAFRSAVAKVGA